MPEKTAGIQTIVTVDANPTIFEKPKYVQSNLQQGYKKYHIYFIICIIFHGNSYSESGPWTCVVGITWELERNGKPPGSVPD